jgi:hypothetical protein
VLPVGIWFALTACGYVVMTMRALDPQRVNEAGLVGVMKSHGVTMMAIELMLLGAFTIAAIATDDFWVRRFNTTNDRKQKELP